MKQKIIAALAALMILSSFAKGQEIPIGQRVPDLVFTKFINYHKPELQLKDFRGKLVILDFWGTSCAGCIRMFPKIDSIQNDFKNNVQYLLVCKESSDSINKFFAKRKKIRLPDVPLLTGDNDLWKLFPSNSFPYHVWIDQEGVVRYKVSGSSTTKISVGNFLNGKNVQLAAYHGNRKVEPAISPAYQTSVKMMSYIGKCNTSDVNSYSKEMDDRVENFRMKCYSVLDLFVVAWDEAKNKIYYPFQKQFLCRDSSNYFMPLNVEDPLIWVNQHYYEYLQVIPKDRATERYELMRQDLKRYFQIEAQIERKMMKGLALTKKSNFSIPCSDTTAEDQFFTWDVIHPIDLEYRYIKNKPFSLFSIRLGHLIQLKRNIPFVDDTGYTGNADIGLSAEALESLDIERINKELNKYGLELKQKDIEVNVLVMKEK